MFLFFTTEFHGVSFRKLRIRILEAKNRFLFIYMNPRKRLEELKIRALNSVE